MQLNKIAIIGLLLGIGGGIAALAASIIAETLDTGFPVVSGLISLIFIAILGGVFWTVFRPMLQASVLLKSGQPAEAVILKLWDTGTTINDDPLVGLLLEVRPLDREPFQAETKKLISRLQTALVQPGMAVQVKYDPNHPSWVAIESFGGGPASELPTGAITVDGQTYTSVDEMPPHVRQACERVMTVLSDADGDGVPDILATAPSGRVQRLKELKEMMDEGLITIQEYEAKKAEILAEM